MAHEASLEGVANSKLRWLLAYNKPWCCTDVKMGDSALFNEATNRRSAPRPRGPARILDIDAAGVTVKFQSQTMEVAR